MMHELIQGAQSINNDTTTNMITDHDTTTARHATDHPLPRTINEIAQACYDQACASGFHDNDYTTPDTQLIATWLINIHGEVSEAWEAYRNGRLDQPCDKSEAMISLGLRPLTCFEEEMADIIIRCFDSMLAHGSNVGECVEIKRAYNATRAKRHGGKLA